MIIVGWFSKFENFMLIEKYFCFAILLLGKAKDVNKSLLKACSDSNFLKLTWPNNITAYHLE